MTLKLSEFNLKSYKEREVILMALTYYASHRDAETIKLFGHAEALADLQQRISSVQCQPGGCDYCDNVEGD